METVRYGAHVYCAAILEGNACKKLASGDSDFCHSHTAARRLRALIAASGLSVTRYASERLGVHQRTLRRYLSGRWEIPATKLAWIEVQEKQK